MSASKKVLLWNELKHRFDRETLKETYLKSILKVLGRKILCVYPDFSFGNQSCHSLGSFLRMTGSH